MEKLGFHRGVAGVVVGVEREQGLGAHPWVVLGD